MTIAPFRAEYISRKSHGRNCGCWSRSLSKEQKYALGVIFSPLTWERLSIIILKQISWFRKKNVSRISADRFIPLVKCPSMWTRGIGVRIMEQWRVRVLVVSENYLMFIDPTIHRFPFLGSYDLTQKLCKRIGHQIWSDYSTDVRVTETALHVQLCKWYMVWISSRKWG